MASIWSLLVDIPLAIRFSARMRFITERCDILFRLCLNFGVASIDFDPDRATLSITDQSDDNLFASLFAIAVVAECHERALSTLAFEIHARDVIQYQVPPVEVAASQVLLNRPLALQQRVCWLTTVHIDVRWIVDTTELPQARIGVMIAHGELATGIDEATDDHRQRAAHPGLRA